MVSMRVRLRREHLGQAVRAKVKDADALQHLPPSGDEIAPLTSTDGIAITAPPRPEVPVKKTTLGEKIRYRFDNVMARGPVAKALALLPVIKPAFDIYPNVISQHKKVLA